MADWFWNIIKKADKNRAKLRSILAQLTQEELRQFQVTFENLSIELSDEEFAQYVDEEESEDGLDDICNWVVSQGNQFYLEIWQNPQKFPKHIAVNNPEILFSVGYEVYWRRFGKGLHDE